MPRKKPVFLTPEQKEEIYRMGHIAGETHTSIGKKYGVSYTAVGKILRKRAEDERKSLSGQE